MLMELTINTVKAKPCSLWSVPSVFEFTWSVLITLNPQLSNAKFQSAFNFASLQSLFKMLLILLSNKSGSTASDWILKVAKVHVKCRQVEINLWISEEKQMTKVLVQKSLRNSMQALSKSRMIMMVQFGTEFIPPNKHTCFNSYSFMDSFTTKLP